MPLAHWMMISGATSKNASPKASSWRPFLSRQRRKGVPRLPIWCIFTSPNNPQTSWLSPRRWRSTSLRPSGKSAALLAF